MEQGTDEDWLDAYDGFLNGGASPLGHALRATYSADNHATLDSAVTGLMIDLSKVPYGAEVLAPAAPTPPCASAIRPSIRTRLGDLLGRR